MQFSSENFDEYRFAYIEVQSSVPGPGVFHRRRGAYSIGAAHWVKVLSKLAEAG
jgi:hypothetical protein